jgi:hypothetical protein
MTIDPSDPAASLSHDLQRRGIRETSASDSEGEDSHDSDSDSDEGDSGTDSEAYGATVEVETPQQHTGGDGQPLRESIDVSAESSEEGAPDQPDQQPTIRSSNHTEPELRPVEHMKKATDGVESNRDDEESSGDDDDDDDDEDAVEEEP